MAQYRLKGRCNPSLSLRYSLNSRFKVRLPSPIGEENGTDIRPDIPTSSSISKHRGSYSRTPSGTRSTDATFTPGNSGKWHDRKPERWR